ncbi:zincin-like metallopeptidase domain-containing protein [Methyloparacoccus murrellii]
MNKVSRRDIYQTVTDRIVAQLEAGTPPWMKPWQAGGPAALPLRSTGQPYSGVNVLTLWADACDKGYRSPYWFGFQTALKLGAHVRKGEHGSPIVYANRVIKTETRDDGEEETRAVPFLKQSTVFNAEQVEGLPEHFYAPGEPVARRNREERDRRLDAFVSRLEADIRHGGGRAFYRIDADYIQVPAFGQFNSGERYYATLAHELTHWTRHPSRLDRDMGRKRWGDAGYAMEELVAELGAAFLCADLGITPEVREDHAAYIAEWLRVLKDDKRAVFTAASKASEAVEFMRRLSLPERGERVAA